MHHGFRLLMACGVAMLLGACGSEEPPPKLTAPEVVAALLTAAVPSYPQADLERLCETTPEELWRELHIQSFEIRWGPLLFVHRGQVQRAVERCGAFPMAPLLAVVDQHRAFYWTISTGSGAIVQVAYFGFVDDGVLRQFRSEWNHGNVWFDVDSDGNLVVSASYYTGSALLPLQSRDGSVSMVNCPRYYATNNIVRKSHDA
jgi:hypothetical protein